MTINNKSTTKNNIMTKVTYKILVANGSSNLTSLTQLHLNEGWELQGGVSITNYFDNNDKLVFQYSQAVCKDVPNG